MRIHLLATTAILTAALFTGCDSAREVSDTGHVNAYGCDQCHGYPPPPNFPAYASAVHPVISNPASCSVCHPATVLPDGHTINGTLIDDGTNPPHIAHRDGQVEVVSVTTVACDSCHGTPPDTGRHLFHAGRGIACATCHKGYVVSDDPNVRAAPEATHMNGAHDVVIQSSGGDYVVQTYAQADGQWPQAECNDCHSHLAD